MTILIQLIVLLVIFGLIIYAVNKWLPLPAPWKPLIEVLLVIVLIVILASLMGWLPA